jgi:outer membrane receptor protein involved in Fe transport
MRNTGKNSFRLGLMATIAGVTSIMGANAQQAQPAPKPAEPQAKTAPANATPSTEVVVVGSRIRRDEFSSTSPVQVITRDETVLAGLSSTTEALQGSGVTSGGAQINNLFGGFVVNGGPGVNTVSLRGLGATKTLVLLNGRRIAPAGTRGAVGAADLNILPSSIVDRIDILKDGASSVYGSDAVAGVVNIITSRGVKGWTLEGQYNRPTEGGGEQARAAVVTGFARDKFEFSGSLEYFERLELRQGDRDWAACNRGLQVSPTTGASLDFVDPTTGQPKCYTITTTGENGVTINTIGTGNISGIGAPGSVAPGATSTFNRWRPNAAIGTGLVGYEGVGGGANNINVRDTFDPRMLNRSLVSPTKNVNAFIQGSYDAGFLGNAEIYGEALWTQRESTQTGYRQFALDYPDTAEGRAALPVNLRTTPVVGGAAYNLGPLNRVRAFIGFGNDKSSQDVMFYKTTAGIRGDFFIPKWRYDAYVGYSKSDADYTFQTFFTDRLLAAAANCTGTVPTSATCVPIPALTSDVIAGRLPQSYVNYVWGSVTGNTKYDETVFSAAIDGPIEFLKLPGGEVQAVLGVEYRKSKINDRPPQESVNGTTYNLTSATPTVGEDAVREVFAEIELPILANMPLAERLVVNLSGRYTDYDSYGSNTTYKIGGGYSPTKWLSFRTARGTSFRAPALFEQFQGSTSGFLAAQGDPCDNYGSLDRASFRFINCNAEIGNTAFRNLSSITVLQSGGAATGLRSESSTNTSFGVVLQPELPKSIGNLSFAVDFYKIEIEDEVSLLGAGSVLSRCYDSPGFRSAGGFCRFIRPRVSTNNFAVTVLQQFTNVATQLVEGFDYNLRFVRDIGQGTLRVNAQATQFTKQQGRLFSDDPIDEDNGTVNSPAWTGTIDANYTHKDWRFFWSTNWTQKMDSEIPRILGTGTTLISNQARYDLQVPDIFIHNASVQYRSTKNWEATVGVRNLTNEKPPEISSAVYSRIGNSPIYSGYNDLYIGRQVFVNINKKF